MADEAREKEFDLQAVLTMAEMLPPEQAANMIRQEAEKNHISWVATSPEEQTAVTKANAVDYINGTLDYRNLERNTPVWEQVMSSAPQGRGQKVEIEPEGLANDYYTFTNLENAYNDGSLVIVNDEP